MSRMTQFKQSQDKWLQIARRITLALAHRRILLGPTKFNTRSEEDDEVGKKVDRLTSQIETFAGELKAVETGGHELGCAALLSDVEEVQRALRLAACVLVISRLVPSMGVEVKTVGELAELIGGQDMAEVLAVRRGFEQDGELRPFVHCRKSVVRDEWQVVLTEESLALALGLEPDEEALALGIVKEVWDPVVLSVASNFAPSSAALSRR